MEQDADRPPDVDLEKPSAARCYDFYLGGAHNFEVDRQLAQQVVAAVPQVQEIARNNRAFLRRAVRYCLDRGIRQFLDLGSGIPTAGNVHEIVHAVDPGARVVYVDNEPVAAAHARTLLEEVDNAAAVQADLLDVAGVLEHPETQRLLDFSRPVAVMLVAVLHFVPDEERPREVIRSYHDRLAAGSYLALSHGTADGNPAAVEAVSNLYAAGDTPLITRSREEVAALVSDFELVDPGITWVTEWRAESPDDRAEDPAETLIHSAVGRKVGR
ncbi:SAM-dependent methyltransferase [Salinifilum aidingensis]